MILLAILAAILFMLIGVPVFVVICGLSLYLFFVAGIDLSAIIIEIHRMATTPVLVAIPLRRLNWREGRMLTTTTDPGWYLETNGWSIQPPATQIRKGKSSAACSFSVSRISSV